MMSFSMNKFWVPAYLSPNSTSVHHPVSRKRLGGMSIRTRCYQQCSLTPCRETQCEFPQVQGPNAVALKEILRSHFISIYWVEIRYSCSTAPVSWRTVKNLMAPYVARVVTLRVNSSNLESSAVQSTVGVRYYRFCFKHTTVLSAERSSHYSSGRTLLQDL